jgi:transcriptional regulator with XRE-family HTH domain
VAMLEREFRDARADRAVSQASIAAAVDVDRSWISRVERGRIEDLSVVRAAELLAAVGLDLSVRAYPAGSPIRDSAHSDLLERFRRRLHPALGWRLEVPLPILGDLRAWDALITAVDWRCGVEGETRPRDLQALERRIALKQRDAEVDFVVLLLPGTRHCRGLLRAHATSIVSAFPVPGTRALSLLAAGRPPGGNAVIVV